MLAKILTFAADAKKAVVGLVGIASLLAASGQLSGTAQDVAQGILAVATVLGIYGARNGAAPVVYDEDDAAAHLEG